MRRLLLLLATPALAADLPPDKGNAIPESAKRPVVVSGKSLLALPKHDLPEGYTLELAAAPPLVTHPIMGCLDDKGRLFIGDATGVNWNKDQLEKNPPNRVLMLEDTDKDGAYDKSTIFADKMTFPQGACWLDGSLYVGSPPSIWKLTDTDNDGIADKREEIVTGFDYTGNAADIHGPFLHPNGRLYWCHGRKGHDVKQKDGTVVDNSKACGIWSCKPDGSDVAWHSLGCGDNPVEVDFTPEGDVIGVQNLYYTQPRGDTIVHWLYGGVYERADQLQAIAHLPRTLETMPVMYNFGHVAVSGCCFWRSYGSADTPVRNKGTEHFLVTHFNTQRLVRMELTPSGSTYKAVENEFLKFHDSPDIHLTDVMEDPRDGSLLLLDTGGWFRIGCPSSLMAKSDILGAIYRIRPKKPHAAPQLARSADAAVRKIDLKQLADALKSKDAHLRRRALEALNEQSVDIDEFRRNEELLATLRALFKQDIDPATEHSLIRVAEWTMFLDWKELEAAESDEEIRLMLACAALEDGPSFYKLIGIAAGKMDSENSRLADRALKTVLQNSNADTDLDYLINGWLKGTTFTPQRLKALGGFCLAFITKPTGQEYVARMLDHASKEVQSAALGILAAQTANVTNEAWFPPLDALLAKPTPLLLDAIKKLKTPHFDAALQKLAADTKQPLSLRLKALDAAKSVKLEGETFAMVRNVLTDMASGAAAKIQAAEMIAHAPLPKERTAEIAPLFATVGPVELKMLLPLLKQHKDAAIARAFAREIAKNPVIASQQESLYRTALADLPVDIFETIILPAYNAAVAVSEAKKRQLGPLAEKVIANGKAARGEAHFKAGKGTCIACHKVGETGRAIGPDLSKIGAIRTERDLLESILFPSNTLARDYEAHIIETRDGAQTLGVIKSHTAEGLLVIDVAGQEKNVPHAEITGDVTLTNSLMPPGLDQTMPESELLDLVAWLRSLK